MDMKIQTMCKFALDSIAKSYKKFLISVLLCVCSFVLIGVVGYAFDVTQYGRKSIESLLADGIERTGIIQINQDASESAAIMHFSEQAYRSKEIKAIGDFGYGGNGSRLKQLLKIQNTYGNPHQGYGEDQLECLYIQYNLIGAFRFDLLEGVKPEELSFGKNEIALYLGNHFKEVPIGTKYEIKDESGQIRYTYKVAGVLKKGAKWLEEENLYQAETLKVSNLVPLDNLVVMVMNDDYGTYHWAYSLEDGFSFAQGEEKLRELAKECGIEISLGTVSGTMKEVQSNNKTIINYVLELFIMVCLVTFVVLVCIQLVNILNDLKEYGILYANGMSVKELMNILFLENVIKVLLSFLLSLAICYMLLQKCFPVYSEYVLVQAQDIFLKMTSWKMALVAIVLMVSSSIIPMRTLSKMQPVEMIGGNRD